MTPAVQKFWAEFYSRYRCPVVIYKCVITSTDGHPALIGFRLEQN